MGILCAHLYEGANITKPTTTQIQRYTTMRLPQVAAGGTYPWSLETINKHL